MSSRSGSPSPTEFQRSNPTSPSHGPVSILFRSRWFLFLNLLVTILFLFVVTSFFFSEELTPYTSLPVNAQYLPAFRALSWLILAGSAASAIVSFVAQYLYGKI
jgi:hypothetical protein